MKNPILVSVLCLTYNHAQYISQCLESILNQKTNFQFEILIHDDASTDGTSNIISQFIEIYPEKIILYNTKSNTTELKNFGTILQKFKPKGKYIAFCEGDDYWTDENKLQIQYDFLELNLNYSFCCHRYIILEKDITKLDLAQSFYKEGHDLEITLELFFTTWVTQPLTAMLRSIYWKDIIDNSQQFNHFRDVHIFYAYLQKGKGISINKFMGAYRVHEKGIVSSHSIIQNLHTSYKIWKELLEMHPTDLLLKQQYLSVVRRIMLYGNFKTKLLYYFSNIRLSSTDLMSFLRLHLYLLKKAKI